MSDNKKPVYVNINGAQTTDEVEETAMWSLMVVSEPSFGELCVLGSTQLLYTEMSLYGEVLDRFEINAFQRKFSNEFLYVMYTSITVVMVALLTAIYNLLYFHKSRAMLIKQAMLGQQTAPVAEDDYLDEDE